MKKTTAAFQSVAPFDVVVIRAGIVGSMVARELSRFRGKVALVEKEPASGFGVSKANPCMLHSPLMFPSGPLRIELAHNAASRYRKLSEELDVSFKEVRDATVVMPDLKVKGLLINEVSPAELERFREAMKPVHEKWRGKIGPELYDEAVAFLKKERQK